MSFTFALTHKDRIYMLTSTKKDVFGNNYELLAPENSYIHKVGDIYIGSRGLLVAQQHLYLHEEWFVGKKLNKRFLVEEIVPKFYKELKSIDQIKQEEESDYPEMDATFIFVQDDKMFVLSKRFEVYKAAEFAIIATDNISSFADGNINALKGEDDIFEISKRFIKSMNEHFGETSKHYKLIDTKTGESQVLEV